MNIDILVCPSYSEGMPTVILEAMARGCAIIATNVGANCTMIGNRNGWLIDGDIKYDLKKSLVEALSFPRDKLLNMKKESVNIVSKNFMWEKVIEKIINETLI